MAKIGKRSSGAKKTTPTAKKSKKTTASEPDVKPFKKSKPAKPAKASDSNAASLWQNRLLRKRSGDLVANRSNVATILQHDRPELVRFNEFTGGIEKLAKSVGHKDYRPVKSLRQLGAWTGFDTVQLQAWLERAHELTAETQVVRDGVKLEACRNGYHPIRDFLVEAAEQWDGRPRADTWLIRHALVKPSAYVRAVSAKWLISCVARVFEPGCQVDHVLILEGQSRAGKTSLLRELVGEPDWFTSTDAELGSKDVLQLIASVWIAELGELESLNRTDWERVKHFLTNLTDRYRPAYGHEVILQPRRVVFAATTEKFSGYLREPNQRFWPVRSHATVHDRVRLDDLRQERIQLWAEAVVRYRAGEPWHITDVDILKQAIREVEARASADPWTARVQKFLELSTDVQKGVSTEWIAKKLGIELKSFDRGVEMRIGGILHALGWARLRSRQSGGRQYLYFRQP